MAMIFRFYLLPCSRFITFTLLVSQKNEGNRPVINLNNFRMFIPQQHFKIEDFHIVRDFLKEKDYMRKVDLKVGYFQVCSTVTGNIFDFSQRVNCTSSFVFVLDFKENSNLTRSKSKEIAKLQIKFRFKILVANLKATLLEELGQIGIIHQIASAILPVFQQMKQQQQIQVLKANLSYQSTSYLNHDCTQELQWWVKNLETSNEKPILTTTTKTIVQMDASKKNWRS